VWPSIVPRNRAQGGGHVARRGSRAELILHHFDLSPYAEKVRTLLGLKALAWRSVQIPMVMPKPDLIALTGGYRKTPVLQIGADIIAIQTASPRNSSGVIPSRRFFQAAAQGSASPSGCGATAFSSPVRASP
jgi:hypothetical protein